MTVSTILGRREEYQTSKNESVRPLSFGLPFCVKLRSESTRDHDGVDYREVGQETGGRLQDTVPNCSSTFPVMAQQELPEHSILLQA